AEAERVQRSPSRIAGPSSRPAVNAATKQTSPGSRVYKRRFRDDSTPAVALVLVTASTIAPSAPTAATSIGRTPRRPLLSGARTATAIAVVEMSQAPSAIASPRV